VIDETLFETRRDESESGGVHRLAHCGHLDDDLFARGTFVKHAHYGTKLTVRPPQPFTDG
jgi:hypothetical protein